MPGSGKQSDEVQQQIVEFLEAGIDPTTIHRRLKVGRSSIYRMKRSLQQHGTAYAPVETNKKNGRPKVMSMEQELAIRDWLKEAKNRERYLDDMVWFIHDRFGMVCSTTTCSKIKRKWLKVLEAEERGEHLDPEDAQEQVRLEAFRVGKKTPRKQQQQQEPQPQMPVPPAQMQMQMPMPMPMHMPLMPYGQHHAPQIDHQLQPHIDHQLQPHMEHQLQQLQSQVAHAALHHQNGM